MRAYNIKIRIQVANGRTAVSCFFKSERQQAGDHQKSSEQKTTMFFLLLLSCLLHLSIIQDGGQLQGSAAQCALRHNVHRCKAHRKIGREAFAPPGFGLLIQICQWLCPDLYFRLNQPVGIAFSSVNNIYLIRLCIAEYIKSCVLKAPSVRRHPPDTSV